MSSGAGYFFCSPERQIKALCRLHCKTVALAESCTGGYISHRLTNVSGSSGYFLGGVVVYSNEAKHQLLGVPEESIAEHGAVSAVVARFMAEGVRRAFDCSVGLSVTGIAGPGGGSQEKPVGLVFIGVSDENASRVYSFRLRGSRLSIKEKTAHKALSLLTKALLH